MLTYAQMHAAAAAAAAAAGAATIPLHRSSLGRCAGQRGGGGPRRQAPLPRWGTAVGTMAPSAATWTWGRPAGGGGGAEHAPSAMWRGQRALAMPEALERPDGRDNQGRRNTARHASRKAPGDRDKLRSYPKLAEPVSAPCSRVASRVEMGPGMLSLVIPARSRVPHKLPNICPTIALRVLANLGHI